MKRRSFLKLFGAAVGACLMPAASPVTKQKLIISERVRRNLKARDEGLRDLHCKTYMGEWHFKVPDIIELPPRFNRIT